MGVRTSENVPPGSRNAIFALDIGTRSVIGLVCAQEDGMLRVLGVETEEYKKRAVVDGQIEDIAETAKTAAAVKARLEDRMGFPLDSVYIAAAGRVLKTQRASFEMDLDGGSADRQFLIKLEAGAVNAARDKLFPEGEDGGRTNFFCVGHSAVRYSMDGYEMSTILDHSGNTAKAEVIATFLPRGVVESLYTAMRTIGLTVAGLTLEPIAAMNAVIPPDIRKLNLAMVDIGAGTSDIAVCEGGFVTAYTMATIAGDEITEAVMQEYLVDFQTAEKMKRCASAGAPIAYTNILGLELEEACGGFLEKLDPAVQELSETIAEKILEINGKPPSAVFLAGGGSQLPSLCARVAKALSLDEKRAAVGGANYMKRVVVSDADIFGPEFATPVGIALTAAAGLGTEAFSITVNGDRLHLAKGWDTTLLDALLLSGRQYSQIMGRAGKSVVFELNGERKTVRGGLPQPAEILLNGQPSSLTALVSSGDSITFQEARPGEDASPTLSSVLGGWDTFSVSFNGAEVPFGGLAEVNGAACGPEYLLQNMDSVRFRRLGALEELCRELGVNLQGCAFTVNGEPAMPETPLRAGDDIRAVPLAQGTRRTTETGPEADPMPPGPTPEAGQPPDAPMTLFLNGQPIRMPAKPDGRARQFVDLFNYIDIDPQNPQGNIVLRLNGGEASYLEELHPGDEAEIRWEKEGATPPVKSWKGDI